MRSYVLAAAVLMGLGLAPRPSSTLAPPTVVILVRHAEKAAQPAQDPPLTEAGAARARALVAVARDAGVKAIISTQFLRTKATAEPTATALSVTPEIVQAGGAPPQHAKAVADQVMKHAGETILVVGHSNTIPAIVGALGAPQPRELCDSEYDQVFVVVLGDSGPARLIRSRYGAANVDDPACAGMQAR
jgi:broad specificity phosphatase PhoE